MPERDALRPLLLALPPTPQRDAALTLLDGPADPFDRQTRPVHFTVSMLLLNPDRSALALIWHEKLGRWLQPGGHIEPQDATLLDSALRELEEETGVRPGQIRLLSPRPLGLDLHAIPAAQESAHQHLDLRCAAVAHDETALREGRWVPFSELEEALLRDAVADLSALP